MRSTSSQNRYVKNIGGEMMKKGVFMKKGLFVLLGMASMLQAAAAPDGDSTVSTLMIALGVMSVVALALVLMASRQRKKYDELSRRMSEEHLELESVIELQEDIMANVGHKLNDPVRTIRERSDKMKETVLDPLQEEHLDMIRRSDELLLDVTNDLIDFLNIKSKKIELRHETFNINNVLDEMAGAVSGRARGSKVEFIFDIEKEVPAKLTGDALRLGQVLTNLLSNAMKFTTEGEVRLHIGRLPSERENAVLEFTISDTGIGIDAERLEDIFTPFSEANYQDESGLGLYISRSLTEMMGGVIELKSKPGQGTSFFVRIPFELPDPDEKRHYRLPSKAYAERKIVIVEVQPTAAEALKKMLEYFKNEVLIRSVTAIENNPDVLDDADMVIVAENAFSEKVREKLKTLKSSEKNKIVMAGNMLDEPHSIDSLTSIIDARIMKPLNLQRVYDLIVDLYEDSIKDGQTQNITPRHTRPTAVNVSYEDVPAAEGIGKQSFSRFAGGSLLIVEDNQINQRVMTSLLKNSGINVQMANDGLEALEIVENTDNRFDLVLMDINMPVMDGYEATKHLRAVPDFADLPIVSLTGLGLPEEIAKMYALGMNAHLTKPVQIGRLYTVFERFLKVDEVAAEPPQQVAPPQPEAPEEEEHQVEQMMERVAESAENAENTSEKDTSLHSDDGMKQASGDEMLYGDILEEFVRLYATAYDDILLALKRKEVQKAQQTALDITGVSGNIGAKKLSETARNLHVAIKERNTTAVKEALPPFKKSLTAALGAIRKHLKA